MKTITLLLHGALGSASQFDDLLPCFSPEQPVFALSFPGHGALENPAPFSMQLFCEAVLQFMDEHNIARANIFGYSMGGYVALQLAASHPERVRRVATYGTKLDWSPEVAAGMNRMFDPEKIESKVPHFAAMLAAAHSDWKSVCTRTSSFLQDLGSGQGIQETSYAQIACPVTIGRGSEDHVVSDAESRHIAGLIPHGQLVELTGGKHQIELVDSGFLFKFVEMALFSDHTTSPLGQGDLPNP